MGKDTLRIIASERRAFWRGRIGRRLLMAILVFSSLVTLCTTAANLAFDYYAGADAIEQRLQTIITTHAAPLGESLWQRDEAQIRLQIQGIAQLPDIVAVEVIDTTADHSDHYAVQGHSGSAGPDLRRDTPLYCQCGADSQAIGLLRVTATHANLWRDLSRRAALILAGQTIKTLVVASFILFIVHRLIGHRLVALTNAVAHFSVGNRERLAIARSRRGDDEIDMLVDTLGTVGQRLSANELELQQTATALRTIVSHLPGTLFRVYYPSHGQKRLLHVETGNQPGLCLAPKPMNALSDEQYRALFHPDEQAFLFEELPVKLRHEGAAEFTMRRRAPDGGWRWLRTWERVVERDDDGMITEGLTVDITSEMEAKLALEASHRRYRDLVHALPVGIFEDEPGKGCVFASDLWCKLSGRPEENMLGTGWTECLHPDDLPRVMEQWLRDVAARAPHHSEVRIVRTDGRERWVLTRAQPRLDEQGELLGYIGSIIDITDRRQYELALERLNHVLRMVAAGNEMLLQTWDDEKSAFSAVCDLLADRGGYALVWIGLVDEADQQCRVEPKAWAGARSDYLDGTDIRWDTSPQGLGPTGAAIRTGQAQVSNDIGADQTMAPWQAQASRFGLCSAVSLPLKTESGTLGCLNLYATATDAFSDEEVRVLEDFAHNVAFTVLALHERRRRREAEANLRQAQTMEALGLLAGSVAHDFNNLLGAIQGFAGFIAADSPAGAPAAYYAQRILMAGKRGRALIGQILSFSRPVEVRRELFAMDELVTETKELLLAGLPHTTRLEVESAAEIPPLMGDRDLLGQALFNLCMNASDALAGGTGTVSIRIDKTTPARDGLRRLPKAGCAQLTAWQDEEGGLHSATGCFDPSRPSISLTVSDNGCGMTANVLDRVFTPFFTTREHDRGTGLGLAAVHRTICAHGGAILVDTQPGRGSRFEMVLPCDAEPGALPSARLPAPRPRPSAGGRVLLVDDNTDFGDMLLAALERNGFEVSPCFDPDEALAGIEKFPDTWDALITDQRMPKRSGLELIRAARAIRPDLPCILCTGYAEDALDDATLAQAGVAALMHKPVEIDELVDRLAGVMQTSRRSPQG